ncbi:prolyl 3-hydroxylase OGFOD1 [Aplysia californica]|uniref:Prolyl 3-hydroxylase OGFOD1 n=1 Tax=Aplysia californica TaxID=6500 RepID=A0ABM0JKM1_APLCA|nr:prolyl 3-hydroxylase OGFOD1 [Aplysia californica]
MNKKKACIESLAALESQEPPQKISRSGSPPMALSLTSSEEGDSFRRDQAHVLEERFNSTIATDQSPGGGSSTVSTVSPAIDSPLLQHRHSHINGSIFNERVQASVAKAFQSSSEYLDEVSGVKLSCEPFRHCVLPNFISKPEYVTDLESALLALPLRDKNNDLYKFSQSRDLNHSKSSTISTFRTICESVRNFLTDVTGIPLNSKIDLFCSQYKYTDVLLCHDDELEERRVAFIYYLVPESWSSVDGGALDLFDIDEHAQPRDVVKSIVPKRNNFLFFEVSSKSFHQVAEVLSEDKTRLSISGWFHGPPLARPQPYVDSLPPALPYGSIEEEIFYSWFNPLYLAPEVQSDIRHRFEQDSEIELTDFLQVEKYDELMLALQDSTVRWKLLGPANKRNYYVADKSDVPQIVAEYLRVIQSDAVFLVLSNLTGLKLHSLAPLSEGEEGAAAASNGNGESSKSNGDVSNPRYRSEVRKWEHGCYTLAHDTDSEAFDFALDSMLYIDCGKEWSFENGGYTSYIAKGEDDELLSVGPVGNSLALVYRDKDTMRFVKHLNHRVSKLPSPRFFEINTVYFE